MVTCPDLKVSQLRLGAVKQMDLLFVVDSSPSMADKQALLKDAIPPLVSRLANPWCVDNLTGQSMPVDGPLADCPEGFAREFAPLEDLHIGVITTSLGSHGGQICRFASEAGDTPNDHARLLPSMRDGLSSYQGLGFLAWDPEGDQLPPGESDLLRLQDDFLAQIGAVGDQGCGFEAPLEAWYRFLIDPNPPEDVMQGSCPSGATGCSESTGTDQVVLQQREAFLRPDSVLAIMMLSDENDCSIIDSGQGWLVGLLSQNGIPFYMPRATSACATDPNGSCCRSCASADTPSGCTPVSSDPECQQGKALSGEEDVPNLRCFDQKRRFGFDLLYPTSRYVVGLTSTVICPSSIYRDGDCSCQRAIELATARGQAAPPCTTAETGTPVANPLYSNLSGYAAFARDPSQVFLSGIVGVPWQDLATPETVADPTKLEYLTAGELAAIDPVTGASRWDVMLGNPAAGVAGDPFLIESVAPRSGNNPITMQAIMPPSTTSPTATINGHEVANALGANLQYSCIFPLQTARDCNSPGAGQDPPSDCDCTPDDDDPFGNPLCQAPDGNTQPYHQYYAKAYPGRRLLQVLRDYGNNSITASICPKIVSGSSSDLGLGYRPAVVSLVERFRCASLDANFENDPASLDFGRVPCEVVAVSEPGTPCDCSLPGRTEPSAQAREQVLGALESQHSCGADTGVACESYCMCGLSQFSGTSLDTCQTATTLGAPGGGGIVSGWCYVDPAEGFGSYDVVASCPVGNERNVRVLGGATPREGETLYSICVPKCAEE